MVFLKPNKTSPQAWFPDDSEITPEKQGFQHSLISYQKQVRETIKKKKSAWAQRVSRASAPGKEGLSSKEDQGGRHFIFIFIFKHRHSSGYGALFFSN